MAAPNIDQCGEHNDCIVVFTGYKCPVCDLIETHETDIKELDDQLDHNADNLTDLRNQVADLKQKLSPS